MALVPVGIDNAWKIDKFINDKNLHCDDFYCEHMSKKMVTAKELRQAFFQNVAVHLNIDAVDGDMVFEHFMGSLGF